MGRHLWILGAGLLVLAAAAACRPRGGSEIAPAEAAPGATAVVRVPGLEGPVQPGAVEVTVGGRVATVLRVQASAGVEFLVPEHEVGETEVAVRLGGRLAGRVPFRVLPSPARQLVLSMTGERVTLVASRGAAGLDRPSRETPVGPGLAYDVLDARGRLVATGILPHPLRGRRELFEPEGRMHGVAAPAAATFTLRIPAPPGGGVVRFYESEPGADLATEAGRAARKFLSEVKVGG